MQTEVVQRAKDAGADEAAVRALVEQWATSIGNKDVDGALAGYAPDVRAFDLIDPLAYDGLEAIRQRLATWFASFEGPIRFEQDNLFVEAGGGVAFVHSLNHVSGATQAGEIDMWWRATLCLRKVVDGAWSVVHSHSSVPFNIESGKASTDLKP